jgi:malate dehydrogenase (oxaloacetate-decarboxylating)(NADP+)
LLQGLSKAVQILPMNASVSEMINLAAIAAHDAIEDEAARIPKAAE